MNFVDFFAGIGGIRLGLERAGHKCIGFCEWDKFARQSYKAMYNTEGEWENNDIRTVNAADVPKADLWTFGFPCQDLSVAGKRKGLQEGERSGLFYEIIRLLSGLAKEDRPKWLLAENVKGLFSAGGGFDFLRCVLELGGLGYNIQYQLLNSKDFGVPQNRERVFIIGCLGDGSGREVFPLRRTDGENPCTSEEQRPIRLGNIYGEQFGTGYAGNVWDKNSIAPALMTMQGGNREPMILDNHGLASAVAIEPNVDGCTGTLTTNGNTSVTKCGTFGIFHNERIRKLTPRECWRLQGFPDEYFDRAVEAGVSNSQLYKQAGNAVTVNVAEAIGEKLKEIEKSDSKP